MRQELVGLRTHQVASEIFLDWHVGKYYVEDVVREIQKLLDLSLLLESFKQLIEFLYFFQMFITRIDRVLLLHV